MPASKAQMKANNKYNRKTYATITVRSKKADNLAEQIDQAATAAGVSKATWILTAITHELERQAKPEE